jgi:hypothetical protein
VLGFDGDFMDLFAYQGCGMGSSELFCLTLLNSSSDISKMTATVAETTIKIR